MGHLICYYGVIKPKEMTFMAVETRIKLTNLISKLPEEAVDSLYEIICPMFAEYSVPEKPCCPHCGRNSVVRNGHKCGKQEYLCKSCGKTFVSTTNTLMSGSHQPREIWEEVINDTLSGDAIDFTAKRLGMTHDCVFRMRHKILGSLARLDGKQGFTLSDVSELDETFVLDCYKGKELPSAIARRPRKHGAKAEKRGISSEYVCICTGVQRKGQAVAQTLNRAKPSSPELQEIFGGHIARGTLVLCDGLKSYQCLEHIADCTVKDVGSENGTTFYNLNTVNAFHSFIKKRYEFYRGVATKYLNRYNALFSTAYKCTARKICQIAASLLNVSSINRCFSDQDVKTAGLLLI